MKTLTPQTPWQRELAPLREFFRDGQRFVAKCTKPTFRTTLSMSLGLGTVMLSLGLLGFVIRLVHIPFQQIVLQ